MFDGNLLGEVLEGLNVLDLDWKMVGRWFLVR